MTFGEDSIQLPDGEELVMLDRVDWLANAPRLDPRETSLDLRRQAGAAPQTPFATRTPAHPSAT